MAATILDDIPVTFDPEAFQILTHIDLSAPTGRAAAGLVDRAAAVARPKVLFKVCYIEDRKEDGVELEGISFTSTVLSQNLSEVERVFPYIATCGTELDSLILPENDVLAEYARMALKRQITEMYKDRDGRVNVFTLDPAIEQKLGESVQNTKQGLMLVVDPAMTELLIKKIAEEAAKIQANGLTAVLICSPNIRLGLRRLIESSLPQVAVLSYNEIIPSVELVSTGMVKVQDDNQVVHS